MGSLVDREVAADAVAGAVIVVEPRVPERRAGEGVELGARRPLREAGHRERDVAPEDTREPIPLLRRRRADRDGPRDVGGAVEVLRARVDQVQHARLEPAVGARRRAVVDDRPVGPGPRDRGEAHVAEERLFRAQGVEALGERRSRWGAPPALGGRATRGTGRARCRPSRARSGPPRAPRRSCRPWGRGTGPRPAPRSRRRRPGAGRPRPPSRRGRPGPCLARRPQTVERGAERVGRQARGRPRRGARPGRGRAWPGPRRGRRSRRGAPPRRRAASGVWATSLPRTLRSHAIESGAVRTTAWTRVLREEVRDLAALVGEGRPACFWS